MQGKLDACFPPTRTCSRRAPFRPGASGGALGETRPALRSIGGKTQPPRPIASCSGSFTLRPQELRPRHWLTGLLVPPAVETVTGALPFAGTVTFRPRLSPPAKKTSIPSLLNGPPSMTCAPRRCSSNHSATRALLLHKGLRSTRGPRGQFRPATHARGPPALLFSCR